MVVYGTLFMYPIVTEIIREQRTIVTNNTVDATFYILESESPFGFSQGDE